MIVFKFYLNGFNYFIYRIMYGKKRKVEGRVENLVEAVRSSSLNLDGVSEEFRNCHAKISGTLTSGLAYKTRETYYLAFNRYADFCVRNHVASLPADPEVIMTYFIYLAENGRTASPVLTARSAIRHFSLIARPNEPSPTDRHDVGLIVRSIEFRYAHPVKKAKPMTNDIIKKMICEILKGEQFLESNFKVKISEWAFVVKTLVKFHCLARFEEMIELRRSSFKFLESGDCEVVFTKGKCNQFHDANIVTIAATNNFYCPVRIIKTYFKVINSSYDYFLYPRFLKDEVLLDVPASYNYSLIKLRETLRSLGYEDFEEFSEHSDRVGGLSTAANAGVSLDLIQVQGRMKSDKVPKMYHKRSLQLRRNFSTVLSKS